MRSKPRCGSSGYEGRQVVCALVFGNLIVQRVGKIYEHNEYEKPEAGAIAAIERHETQGGKKQSQGQPRRVEFAHRKFRKLDTLVGDPFERKGKEDLILMSAYVPPYSLHGLRIAPIHRRQPARCQWQIGVDDNRPGDSEKRRVEKLPALEET